MSLFNRLLSNLRFKRPEYAPIPSYHGGRDPSPPPHTRSILSPSFSSLRRAPILFLFGFLFGFWYFDWGFSTIADSLSVPSYDDIKAYETSLPQHDLDLPFPEGRNGRFIKFNVPYQGLGWNNQLQDILMVSQIALVSYRAYAFQPYIWSSNPFSSVVPGHHEDKMGLASASIPLNAFVSGPVAGGVMNTTANPRFISWEWWEKVCPPERRVIVNVPETQKELGIEAAEGKEVVEAWGKKLREMEDSCIQVDGGRVYGWG